MTTAPPLAVAAEARQIPQRRAGRRRGRGAYALRVVLAVVAAGLLLFPLYWMVVVAFSPRAELFSRELRLWPSTFTLDNFTRIFTEYPVVTWLGNSVVITVFVTVLTVVLNLMAGYAFARLRFRGRNVILLLALSTLMLPVQVIMVSQFQLVTRLGIYGTYWAVILPSAATAFGIFLSRQFIIGIPQEIIEAARVDGAGHVRVFLKIVLPLCKPLIAVLILLTAMSTWNDFAWPLIALKENYLFTLPIGLLFLRGQYTVDFNMIMAMALLATLPMVLLFLVFQRYFVQGFTRSGIK
ncbi:carbohydrate ABC transporter permease [Herbiconiux sp. SYSU D00978]|uniref:carbohydrate ABC transporter permease n=1 Tax=Herbiconiux sp. SYSU D00978 TaxID=2812562 RepID=UPI0027DC5AD7|nr:carbohydrate ABC transporter permease [Herbiconiux sp. SYSU D00978]